MPFTVGQNAPDFTLRNQDDVEWTLSKYRGRTVLLLWYPLDWSPTCEAELKKASEKGALGGTHAVVAGISRDSTWSHRAWRLARNITPDLLADPMLQVTSLYGLQHPRVPFISHRATVIVDKTGKIAFRQIQERTSEERDWVHVQEALASV